MTQQKLQEFVGGFFQECHFLASQKNEDYACEEDALRNFRASGWPEIGLYTRMTDKMQRLRSFLEKGSLSVPNETRIDTLMDLANYCALYAALLKDEDHNN